jgi:hypothetical protein
MSLEIAAAAYIYINLASKKKRWWQTQLYHSRSVSGGSSLLNDLRGEEMNGQFHNFTRMDSDDYDLLLNLIGRNWNKTAFHPILEHMVHATPSRLYATCSRN